MRGLPVSLLSLVAGAIAGTVAVGSLGAGCSSSSEGPPAAVNPGPDATSAGPDAGTATPAEDANTPETTPDDAGDAATPGCITPASPQDCAAPSMTALPICKLGLTGCMDPANPTSFAVRAIHYEVNSPLWSDGAAKSRAFVLPVGGKIHVKDCRPDAGAAALADCTSPMGIPNGPADTGKWVFPVGTVMIKNFVFDGKVVETRLLMRVDAATAAVIQNGTDWVGYNYAWNEAQTEATVVPGARTSVRFDTGTRTVTWNYPNFLDCIGCHNPAVGTLGPENDQMNRVVDGGNQIDTFVAMGLFDTTAPKKPYAAALVEPYASADLGLAGPPAGATLDEEARSYLSANCGFCHRPDVNDQGFDLRAGLSLAAAGICGLAQQNGIPGMASAGVLDLAPGDHARSAMWIRMNTPVPASDPDETTDVGRMPPASSFVVDPQATALIGQWIDAIKSCPDAGR
jgi:cytochrome c551/c552